MLLPDSPESGGKENEMETYTMYVPLAKKTNNVDKIEVFAELIPKGKENAIKRSDLVDKCIEVGLIKADSVRDNQDRAMRRLLQIAKMDYSITNDGDGAGYYRPTKEDYQNLRKNNNRENKKAISTLGGLKNNKAIAEDYRVGRLDE